MLENATEEHDARHGCGRHARQLGRRRNQLLHEHIPPLRRVSLQHRIDRNRRGAVGFEPGVDVERPRHALEEQRRRDEQRERHGNLRDDERAAETPAAGA